MRKLFLGTTPTIEDIRHQLHRDVVEVNTNSWSVLVEATSGGADGASRPNLAPPPLLSHVVRGPVAGDGPGPVHRQHRPNNLSRIH